MDYISCQRTLIAPASEPSLTLTLFQVIADNFVHYTFIYFPVFYVFKQSIQVHPPLRTPLILSYRYPYFYLSIPPVHTSSLSYLILGANTYIDLRAARVGLVV